MKFLGRLAELPGVRIFEFLSQLDQLHLQRSKSVGRRIRHIGVIHRGIGKSLALRFDDSGRDTDYGRIRRNRFDNNGIGADFHIVADRDAAENFCPRPDHHMIPQGGMALAALFTGAAERHALKQRDVVSDFGGFSDHHTHTMIDKKRGADLCTRMNLDSGQPSRELGDRPGQKRSGDSRAPSS